MTDAYALWWAARPRQESEAESLLAAITDAYRALPHDPQGHRFTTDMNSRFAVIAVQSRAFLALPGQAMQVLWI